MYLFDSDVLITLNNDRASEALRRRVRGTPRHLRFTSAINLGEILRGAYGYRDRDRLVRRIEQLFTGFRMLAFDTDAARIYARLAFELTRKGESIGEADTRIAAIALARNLTVVTGNVRHFSRVPGLRLENWL